MHFMQKHRLMGAYMPYVVGSRQIQTKFSKKLTFHHSLKSNYGKFVNIIDWLKLWKKKSFG